MRTPLVDNNGWLAYPTNLTAPALSVRQLYTTNGVPFLKSVSGAVSIGQNIPATTTISTDGTNAAFRFQTNALSAVNGGQFIGAVTAPSITLGGVRQTNWPTGGGVLVVTNLVASVPANVPNTNAPFMIGGGAYDGTGRRRVF
jgi:hypothetical protein